MDIQRTCLTRYGLSEGTGRTTGSTEAPNAAELSRGEKTGAFAMVSAPTVEEVAQAVRNLNTAMQDQFQRIGIFGRS